jgi:signal transduction histidine kinase
MARPPGVPSQETSYATPSDPGDLPRLTGWLSPAVNAVARLHWQIRHKLLAGFLAGAVLLIAMGGLSLVVLERMNDHRLEFELAQRKAEIAQEMLYQVTAQSHYRAMTLLLNEKSSVRIRDPNVELRDPAHYVVELAKAKKRFATLLTAIEAADPQDKQVFDKLQSRNKRYEEVGQQVTALYRQGDLVKAKEIHIRSEHKWSHRLEDELNNLVRDAEGEMRVAGRDFESSHRFLESTVIAVSGFSVLAAMTLGFVFSWSILRPVRKVQGALVELSNGDFPEPVSVPNRDELGSLTRDLNATSDRLQTLFANERELAAELGETNQSLVRAGEAKSRFLANVSHELRTPMNAVLGFTEALLAGVDGPINDEQRRSLEWVRRGGGDLLNLINELLDLSRIEAGKLTLQPEPFRPVDLLEVLMAQHRSLAAQKGLGLSYDASTAPAEVVQDPQRVRQILSNLLGNAVRLTDEGEVSVVMSGESDDGLSVLVRDTGPGIPQREREAIFEDFYQAHGSGNGTGLGLAISRRLARAMGGDVTVVSEVGVGSTFRLWVPRAIRSQAETDTRTGTEEDTSGGVVGQAGAST